MNLFTNLREHETVQSLNFIDNRAKRLFVGLILSLNLKVFTKSTPVLTGEITMGILIGVFYIDTDTYTLYICFSLIDPSNHRGRQSGKNNLIRLFM